MGSKSGITMRAETLEQTEDTLERLYLSAGLGMSPLEGLVDEAEERSIWITPLKLVTRVWISGRKQNKTKQNIK